MINKTYIIKTNTMDWQTNLQNTIKKVNARGEKVISQTSVKDTIVVITETTSNSGKHLLLDQINKGEMPDVLGAKNANKKDK